MSDNADHTDQRSADGRGIIWPLVLVVLIAGIFIAFAATGSSW